MTENKRDPTWTSFIYKIALINYQMMQYAILIDISWLQGISLKNFRES